MPSWFQNFLTNIKFPLIVLCRDYCQQINSQLFSSVSVHKQQTQNLPPVLVELSVSKAKQLSCEVQRRVEEPVEKHQPQQVIWDLKKSQESAGNKSFNVYIIKLCFYSQLISEASQSSWTDPCPTEETSVG